jgi:hypothetical protein
VLVLAYLMTEQFSLRWLDTVFKKMDLQLLLVDKQKVPCLYKTKSKEFEFLHKSYATTVAMATMTFQDGGYFGFKVI